MPELWLVALAAGVVPLVFAGFGALRAPRDAVWALVYGQSLVYLFVAPAAVAGTQATGAQGWYQRLGWQALVLFAVPATALYAWWVARAAAEPPSADAAPPWQTGGPATLAVVGGSVAAALGFCWAAAASGLFYRRIGTEALAEASADLPIAVFAVYRTFVEAAPFLLALQVMVLRRALAPDGWQRGAWRVALGATGVTFGAYVLVNSRQQFALLVAMFVCLAALTRRRGAGVRPERVLLGLALVGVTVYGLRVIENVRDAVGEGRSIADPRNLLWARSAALRDEESVFARANGIDLIVRTADGVRAQGPAVGTLWLVPAVVSLDPIVRTDQTEALKRAGLTTAKSFMLLRYAGVAETDYYSSIVTDAYGNFGPWGFALVAVVLARLVAYVVGALTTVRSPAAVVAGCFMLSRVLPFEQEFATLLFGWLKLSPVVLALMFVLHRWRARGGPDPSAPVLRLG